MCEYLPLEILTLILKRLPVESVVKCTAVCKTWYAVIKHPSFISTHLQEAALCDDLLLFHVVRDERDAFHLRRDNDALEEYKQLHFPFRHEHGSFTTVGTCNGLICLAKLYPEYWNVILWNPCIRKHFILPKLHFHFPRGFSSIFGFGFDSVSNDYKVLLIISEYNYRGEVRIEVWLFSLNRRSWRNLSEVCPKHSCYGLGHRAPFVKGAFHWLGCVYDMKNALISNMILTFDISTEQFHVMNYPNTLDPLWNMITLIKYEESIAVVAVKLSESSYEKQRELWVMKEYCVNSSWTKVLHWIDEEKVFIDDFEVWKNGKVLLKTRRSHKFKTEHELATLDLNCYQNQPLMPVVGINVGYKDSFVVGFVESLVLLDKGEEDPEGQNGFQLYVNSFPSLRRRPPTVRRNAQTNAMRVPPNFGDPLADQGASMNP